MWKSKYSVWLKTGECAFLREAVLDDMHQIILTTSKSGSVFTGFYTFFKEGLGKSC